MTKTAGSKKTVPAHLRWWRAVRKAGGDALGHFNTDDGWAVSSHVALSVLMALFPFLIFVTALAGFFGSRELADQAAVLLFQTWPEQIAAPIAKQVTVVLTETRGDLLTIGAAVALLFASNGVEALRVGLNRAYRMNEDRPIWRLRLQSLGFILLGAVVLLVMSFLLVLAPVVRAVILEYAPRLALRYDTIHLFRLGAASVVILAGLAAVHKWLPAGHRRFADIWPGVAVTFALWFIGATGFAAYLERFSTYASTYAGLAGVMVALVFLYLIAVLFILGGELNAAIVRYRTGRRKVG